jgi:putative SOS response-associated peptidase YedK
MKNFNFENLHNQPRTNNYSMCNYMGFKVTKEQNLRLKDLEKEYGSDIVFKALQNGFEYGDWGIVKPTADKKGIEIVNAHWEFIPPWIKNLDALKAARKQGIPWLNASAEKLLESKMFRDAALHRRCLVPISWFFEWRHEHINGAKKATTFPYIISLPDKEYFYAAGIYQPWTDKETGETMYTFAIVTTKANSFMEQLHNVKKRMPAILTEELAYEWIMNDITENRIQEIASKAIDASTMDAYTIAKEFRVMENPTEAFEYEGLGELVKL